MIGFIASFDDTHAKTSRGAVSGGKDTSQGSGLGPFVDHRSDAGKRIALTAHRFEHHFRGVDQEDDIRIVARGEARIGTCAAGPVANLVLEASATVGVLAALLVAASGGVPLAAAAGFASWLSASSAGLSSAGTRREGFVPVALGIIRAVEFGGVVRAVALDFTGAANPCAESGDGAISGIEVGARIFVASVVCSAEAVGDVAGGCRDAC